MFLNIEINDVNLNSLLLASSASGSIRQPVSASGRRRTSRKTQVLPYFVFLFLSFEILIFVYFKLVWVLSSQSQIGRHLHALDNDIKLHALPEKHHMTQPESWNHHTPWRKTMVMESQTQTLVWLWYGEVLRCV